jgi:hypothetical protein
MMNDIVERLCEHARTWSDGSGGIPICGEAAAEIKRLRALLNIDLDACAVPMPEQLEQMKTSIGALYTPAEALVLGMQTAIGNVKRARATKTIGEEVNQ